VDVGTKYVEKCYNRRVLETGSTSWAGTGSDGFLIAMYGALNIDMNNAEYVRCLRKALADDPSMIRGVDWLLSKVRKASAGREQEEFDKLRQSVLKAIKNAINNGELDTAVSLINEYEDIVGVDAPICSARGIIYMMNGQWDEAEKIFLAGLEIEPENEDLLYNLDYLRNYVIRTL
jgi:tetratricopeptide (TPR) repeat protein